VKFFPLLLLLSCCAQACTFTGLSAKDYPNDNGQAVIFSWKGGDSLRNCAVETAPSARGPWLTGKPFNCAESQSLPLPFWVNFDYGGRRSVRVAAPREGAPFYARLTAADAAGTKIYSDAVYAAPRKNFFNILRLNTLLLTLFLAAAFLFFRNRKKRGAPLRELAGLSVLEEKIAKAARLDKPVYFMTGRQPASSMSTIAAINLLSEVARKTARLGAKLKVPHSDSLVMGVCADAVREAYEKEGRAADYRPDINFFITEDQFAYTAAVNDLMARERPALCVYAGYYYAESLLLTEAGGEAGSFQIAATDAEHQLPFFFSACDHTIMGEELYAAAASVSKDEAALSAVRMQDAGKILAAVCALAGAAALIAGKWLGFGALAKIIADLFKVY